MTTPTVIELAGPPASGKTTTASLLWELLLDAGYRAAIVREAAERAPFPPEMKRDWRFTAWTLFQTVSEVLRLDRETSEYDFVIFDRGLVDEQCWIEWFASRRQMDAHTSGLLTSVATDEQWFPKKELLFVLTVKFETAVRRRGLGRIINEQTYDELARIYARFPSSVAKRQHLGYWSVATDQLTSTEVAETVFRSVLDQQPIAHRA